MGQISHVDWEEGDVSDANNTVNGTDISINSTSPIIGTYDLDVLLDGDQTVTYVQVLLTHTTEVIRFRIYFRFSDLSMSDSTAHLWMNLRQDGSYPSGNNNIFQFEVSYSSGSGLFSIRPAAGLDDGSLSYGSYVDISSGNHYVEVYIVSETSDGNDDGYYDWWIDGSAQTSGTGLGNVNIMDYVYGYRLGGLSGLDSSTTGSCYFDEIIVRDDSTTIGAATATSTGLKFPQSAVTADETPHSDNDWSNGTNIEASDTNEASITPANFDTDDRTYIIKGYNFDFSSIPSGATIDGVECSINARYADGSASIDLVQLLDTSLVKGGDNKASTPVALATSTVNYLFGAGNDKWGLSLTDTWVKNSNFGVAIGMIATGDNADVFIDYVTLIVYYTASASISLSTATATAGGQALTVIPGEAITGLNTAAIIAGGQAISLSPGEAIIALATAALTASGQSATIVPGAISIPLGTAAVTVNGQVITIDTSAAITIPLNTATATTSGQSITILPGTYTLNLSTGQITANGQAITIVPGAVAKALNTANVDANGQALTLTPGSVAKALTTANIDANGQAVTIVPGETIITLTTADANANGQEITIIPGAISVNLSTGQITIAGQAITIEQGFIINLSTANIAAGGQAISLLMGEAVTGLNTAQITAGGQAITLSLGEAVIALSTAALIAGGQDLSLVPGEVTTQLNTANIDAVGQVLSLLMGAVSTGLNTATINADGQSITISVGNATQTIGLNTAQISADGQSISLAPGGVIISIDTANLTAEAQEVVLSAIATIVKSWNLYDRSTALTVESRSPDLTLNNRSTDWTLETDDDR